MRTSCTPRLCWSAECAHDYARFYFGLLDGADEQGEIRTGRLLQQLRLVMGKREQMGYWWVRHGGVLFGIAFITSWVIVVLLSGWGVNATGIDWDFERTGQLGDSFGVLGAMMAAAAAYFAFRTYQSAREDVARLEQRASEPSYLNLLERRFDVLDRVRLSRMKITTKGTEGFERIGQNALDWIVMLLRKGDEDNRPLSAQYERFVSGVSGLSNLYRFTYHIVSYADRQFTRTDAATAMTKADPAYQYVRLLRAQMSDSELVLVALNCAFGPGHEKFKPLVERYALLHNMNPSDRSLFGLDDLFEPTAFGITPEDRIAHGDGPPNSSIETESEISD